jgi:hypothetical protein
VIIIQRVANLNSEILKVVAAGARACRREAEMEKKKLLAGWSKVCPGCNIGRKYPDSFIGRKVRNHWEKGCPSHDAYVEVYGSEEASPKKTTD